MGLSAVAITKTRCWSGLGFGSGVEELILRFLSKPPFVLEYCYALIVERGKVMARDITTLS
jgi:hypothetical protein